MTVPPFASECLADAVARAAKFRDRTVVVKLGGSAMEDPAATAGCLRSAATLKLLGVPVVLVHGGGKPIDRAMASAGLMARKVAGRRYTDDATLEIVVRVLAGEINADLVRRLVEIGVRAIGAHSGPLQVLHGQRLALSGPDGQRLDLGRVGSVTRVDADLLGNFLSDGMVPVIPSLAFDAAGHWLNVNADTAAAAVAGALKASRAAFLTDTPGVLRDRSDPASLVARLTEAECRRMIESGAIDGGMVPKVEACFEALAAGAGSALILDGRVPYSLLDSFVRESFGGTEIVR